MDPRDELVTTPIGDPLDDIRHHLDDVMSGGEPAPVDVRAYLLDPPPTAEEAARLERRRLLVRRGSIAACALVAVLLLAPWPSDEEPSVARAAETGPVADLPTDEPELPQRVDLPLPRASPPRRARTPDRPRAVRTAPARTPRAPAPIRAAPRSVPVPDPAPQPAPAEPVTAPTQDAGVLVPVI
jgi:hypothetical protein